MPQRQPAYQSRSVSPPNGRAKKCPGTQQFYPKCPQEIQQAFLLTPLQYQALHEPWEHLCGQSRPRPRSRGEGHCLSGGRRQPRNSRGTHATLVPKAAAVSLPLKATHTALTRQVTFWGPELTSTNSACSDHLLHLQDNHKSKETKRLTDTEKKLVVTSGGRSRGVSRINYLVYDRLKDASHSTENIANILQ